MEIIQILLWVSVGFLFTLAGAISALVAIMISMRRNPELWINEIEQLKNLGKD